MVILKMITFAAHVMHKAWQGDHAAFVLFWKVPPEVLPRIVSDLTPVSATLQSVVPEKPKRWIQLLNSAVCGSETLASRR